MQSHPERFTPAPPTFEVVHADHARHDNPVRRAVCLRHPAVQREVSSDAAPSGQLAMPRDQRADLLEQVAELVQQRDEYRARMHKAERMYREAREEAERLRHERDEALARLPAEERQPPTQRRPLGADAVPRVEQRPDGTYHLRGVDIRSKAARRFERKRKTKP